MSPVWINSLVWAALAAWSALGAKAAPGGDSKVVHDEPKAYEQAKTMIVGYKEGRFDEAKDVCEKAGLKIVHVSRGTQYVLCQWKDKEALDTGLKSLAEHSDVIEFVEPVRSTPLIAPPPPPVKEVAPPRKDEPKPPPPL